MTIKFEAQVGCRSGQAAKVALKACDPLCRIEGHCFDKVELTVAGDECAFGEAFGPFVVSARIGDDPRTEADASAIAAQMQSPNGDIESGRISSRINSPDAPGVDTARSCLD